MSRTLRVVVVVALAAVVAAPAVAPGVPASIAGHDHPNGTPTGPEATGIAPPPSTCAGAADDGRGPAPAGENPAGEDPAATPPPRDPPETGAATGSTGPDAPGGSDPRILAVHPNPHVPEDRGEFVAVAGVANGTGWTLADGEGRARLPNGSLPDGVAVSPDPAVARNLTDRRVVGTGDLSLSNAGERLELRHGGAVVDAAEYADAPEGELLWANGTASGPGHDRWRALTATDRGVAALDARSVRAFVLPDAPAVPVETLRAAERRVLLAGYTLTSRRIADALRTLAARGVTVRVLVDAAPVGGMARREARLLDSLVAAGVDVRVYGGERAPYEFHHAKYAVVDDRALVLTENFKPAGTGGHSSRGWGVAVRGRAVAAELADLFRTDARPRTAIPWDRYRRNATLVEGGAATGTYPSRVAPRRLPVEGVRVLVAPDNAERALVGVLCSATRSIRVIQMSAERGPLLWATMAAARRGVRVRILLGGARYVREANRRIARRLNAWAAREGVDLRAKVAEPRSRFGKIHAKGVVVDGDQVVVGSINWNNHSLRENREMAVVLSGDRVGRYYARVFDADWRGGAWRLPAGLVGLVGAVFALSVGVGIRRIRFGG